MNKKLIGFALALAFLVALSAPIVAAMPGAEKNNEKFVGFAFILQGYTVEDVVWTTPPEPAEPKTEHGRYAEWEDTSITIIVDGETYTETTTPVSISYEGGMSWDNNIDDVQVVRVTEIVTFWYDGSAIGTLEWMVKDQISYGNNPNQAPVRVKGTFVGHGTGALEGVVVAGTDAITGMAPFELTRSGTATNWPVLPPP